MEADSPAELAEVRRLPDSLWARLRADPLRAPEHLALAAAQRHGPAAARWLAQRRSMYAYGPAELAAMARKRHVSIARFEGAAAGVGGLVTMLPDLASLAWIQSRMVFFVAAAYGYDPLDGMRPAELLVLQQLYDDPYAARRALDGAGESIAQAYVGSRLSRDEQLGRRLARMVGRRAGERLAGRALPGVAVVFNSRGNARDTRQLADRALRFYGG